jgi:cysteine desulfurase
MPVYLDCNATAPTENSVNEVVMKYLSEEFGNSGSRTHEFGTRAKRAVQQAREQIATVIQAEIGDIVFTSGATESNNLSILGLAAYGEEIGHKHIISSQIEHKAVLEPLEVLSKRGFEVTLVPPTLGGWVEPEAIQSALREETLLVSLMHANNETGVLQPIEDVANILDSHTAFFHVDAAQSYGKELEPLKNPRIDLMSLSAHKVYGPKGVGALVMRKRKYKRPPIQPLVYGGGQERGIRPGTLPVALIAGFGQVAELAKKNAAKRKAACTLYRQVVLEALLPLNPIFNGDKSLMMPHVLNISFPGLDSEAVMVTLKDQIAISNGSACTSQSYEPSHVLKAMNLSDEVIEGALRISWCHMTELIDWDEIVKSIQKLM